jgi:hypothetical protein
MIYKVEVEVEIDDDKISFAEELLKSISFVRKVKMIVPETKPVKTKLSDKYRGILSKEQGQSLQAHIQKMRNGWDTI